MNLTMYNQHADYCFARRPHSTQRRCLQYNCAETSGHVHQFHPKHRLRPAAGSGKGSSRQFSPVTEPVSIHTSESDHCLPLPWHPFLIIDLLNSRQAYISNPRTHRAYLSPPAHRKHHYTSSRNGPRSYRAGDCFWRGNDAGDVCRDPPGNDRSQAHH